MRLSAGVLLVAALAMLGAGCASQDEIDARCKRDLQQMRASDQASERYYDEISAVVVGLSDDLDRESARTEADRKAAELAAAVGDEVEAATFSTDAAAHEDRVKAINAMLDAPPPPFPTTSRVSPDEQDWMFMNECNSADRMRRMGLDSLLQRKQLRPVLDEGARLDSGSAMPAACDIAPSVSAGESGSNS